MMLNIKTYILLSLIIILNGCTKSQNNNEQAVVNESDMLEEALVSVVTVAVYKTDYGKQQLGMRGNDNSDTEEAYKAALDMAGVVNSGSGFIIERGGELYILTNAHVIENASDEPQSIFVFSYDRQKFEVAVFGGDSFYDLALLKFIDQPDEKIKPLEFKKTSSRIGEKVFAIGNPLGEYPNTVTDGIISALNRSREGITGKFGFLQTTATVIWGNSGGPLVDINGNVVGINSQIAFATAPDGSQLWQSQINFALEASLAKKLIDDILNHDGRVLRSYLGLEIGENYKFQNKTLVKIDERPKIKSAITGSLNHPVINENLNAFIFAVNDVETRNIDEVLGEFEKVKPGDQVHLQISKNGELSIIKLKSIELKEDQLVAIAKYFIELDPNITANFNRRNVVIKLGRGNYYNKYNYKNNRYGRSAIGSANYIILAGGIYNKHGSNIWQISDYKDLGAVLKLCGLYGVFDFFVTPERSNEDKIEIYRKNISEFDNVLQKTLWY